MADPDRYRAANCLRAQIRRSHDLMKSSGRPAGAAARSAPPRSPPPAAKPTNATTARRPWARDDRHPDTGRGRLTAFARGTGVSAPHRGFPPDRPTASTRRTLARAGRSRAPLTFATSMLADEKSGGSTRSFRISKRGDRPPAPMKITKASEIRPYDHQTIAVKNLPTSLLQTNAEESSSRGLDFIDIEGPRSESQPSASRCRFCAGSHDPRINLLPASRDVHRNFRLDDLEIVSMPAALHRHFRVRAPVSALAIFNRGFASARPCLFQAAWPSISWREASNLMSTHRVMPVSERATIEVPCRRKVDLASPNVRQHRWRIHPAFQIRARRPENRRLHTAPPASIIHKTAARTPYAIEDEPLTRRVRHTTVWCREKSPCSAAQD